MGSQQSIVPVNYVRKLSFKLDSRVCNYRYGFSRNNKVLVDQITTLRRHLEAAHSVSDNSTLLSFC
jgi:hypothetical protein